jgi:hypothetical protein
VRCEGEMKVDELLPESAEPFKPESANVSSLEELLELPFIKFVARNHGKFYRFSCRRMDDFRRMDDHWLLLADLHGTWRVIGLLSGGDAEHIINPLPMWTFSKPRST